VYIIGDSCVLFTLLKQAINMHDMLLFFTFKAGKNTEGKKTQVIF